MHCQNTQLYLVTDGWPDCDWSGILEARVSPGATDGNRRRGCGIMMEELAMCDTVTNYPKHYAKTPVTAEGA
jgi:hypothetical protein